MQDHRKARKIGIPPGIPLSRKGIARYGGGRLSLNRAADVGRAKKIVSLQAHTPKFKRPEFSQGKFLRVRRECQASQRKG